MTYLLALYVLAALLTLLQLFDGWTTYEILKRGGVERNPVIHWLMKLLGTYEALVLFKGLAIALVWALVFIPIPKDVTVILLIGLTMLYIWAVVGNWKVLQEMKGRNQ